MYYPKSAAPTEWHILSDGLMGNVFLTSMLRWYHVETSHVETKYSPNENSIFRREISWLLVVWGAFLAPRTDMPM